ncbi:Oidioi.mRNA.OKI2018_I69.PAR.g12947.t1.cds [Oikopleura dioica]|uniref:Oidioi.mRNA.OKI2018_I69.PAR.g12947.t1.cds n=1 Tax=Oikopleura dioica TaxID=34765 RepID=A0ABN7S5X5_OIKDI|nr:Oidioi.mRNA.OKI2018_I69.PAR.g12947.t1.cds [Oikopleura dioica]
MSQPVFLKFDDVKGHQDFQMKINRFGTADYDFEFSCGCGFLVPTIDHLYFADLSGWMLKFYEGVDVEKEQSNWNDPHFKRTSHVFCDKDGEQDFRILDLIKKRRQRLATDNKYPDVLKDKEISMHHDRLLQICYKTLLTHEKEPRFPESKKSQRSKQKTTNTLIEKPLMNDDELVKLFNDPATEQKKNKKTKKNNQRKPKKPTKK